MPSAFSPYQEYVNHLRKLARGGSLHSQFKAECARALDGEAGRELVRLVPECSRRKKGTFFTSSKLADELARRLPEFSRKLRLVDPTVGAGDLLLAAARTFRPTKRLQTTIETWNSVFGGLDSEGIFVEAARLRLWLLAHVVHAQPTEKLPDGHFLNGIKHGDVLLQPEVLNNATDVLLNPPFSRIAAPRWYESSDGVVNAAAVIVSHTINNVPPGTRIHAILPEVLRTGSHYTRWRKSIDEHSEVTRVRSVGLFESADVDVFIVTLKKKRLNSINVNYGWSESKPSEATVDRHFSVSVGAVVEYRDPHAGPLRAYVHAKNIRPWTEVSRVAERRRFSGTVVKPPFVVIRRTSRPGDKWRASATILLGRRSVAVDNHLVVCIPRSGGLAMCRTLIKALRQRKINEHLNRSMRCRHLTTGAVRDIPFDRPKVRT